MNAIIKKLYLFKRVSKKETILTVEKAVSFAKETEPEVFHWIDTESLMVFLEEGLTYKLKPVYKNKELIFKCVIGKLRSLSESKFNFDNEYCAREIKNALFESRFLYRWNIRLDHVFWFLFISIIPIALIVKFTGGY